MSTRRVLSYLASLSFVVVATGCSAKTSSSSGDVATATEEADSVDANASSAQTSQFSEIFVQSIQSSQPEQAAIQVQGSGLWPVHCSTRTADPTNPRVVHIHFDGCTGPFGLVSLSGDMTAVYSTNASGGLHVEVTSSDLTANGKPVSHSGSGDVTMNGTERDIAWTGAWTRVNAKGETVAHTTQLAIAVDTVKHCRDVNGTAVTNVADREVDSTIKDYRFCKDAAGEDECPSGTVTHTHVKSGRTITVSFDGSTEATFTGPRGGTLEVGLVCPAEGS